MIRKQVNKVVYETHQDFVVQFQAKFKAIREIFNLTISIKPF